MLMLHHFSTYNVLAPIEGSVSYLIMYKLNECFFKLQNQIMKRYVYEDILLVPICKNTVLSIYKKSEKNEHMDYASAY